MASSVTPRNVCRSSVYEGDVTESAHSHLCETPEAASTVGTAAHFEHLPGVVDKKGISAFPAAWGPQLVRTGPQYRLQPAHVRKQVCKRYHGLVGSAWQMMPSAASRGV